MSQPNRPATPEEIAASGFDIPSGQYKARGIEGSDQMGKSKNENDEVSFEVSLVDIGRTVTTILNFSEAATPYSLDRLRLMGWEGGDTFAGISKNEVPVTLRYEVYEGEVKMKVEIISSRFSFGNPMGEAEKRGFFHRLNQIAAQQQGRPRPAAPPPAAAGAPPAGSGYPENWDAQQPDPNRAPIKI